LPGPRDHQLLPVSYRISVVTIPAATFQFFGIPVLALAGAAFAVVGVFALSRSIDKSAWETVGRLLRPPGALGRALLPLLLPVAVVCFFASGQLGPTLQVASGVTLAGLVWLLVHGDGAEFKNERTNLKELREALSPRTPYPRTLSVPVLVGLLGAAAFVVAGLGTQLGTWKTAAGWSGVSEYFGLVLVGTAAVLRLFGYATNIWRSVVSAALFLLTIRSLTWAGVLRGDDFWTRVHLGAAWTALVLVGVIVLAFGFESLAHAASGKPGERHRLGRAFGRLAASGSATLLFLALFIAGFQTTGGADRLAEDDFGAITPTATPTIVDTPLDAAGDLAWTFAPVLHLQHDEQYPPAAVEAFFAGSTQSGAKPIVPASDPLTLATLPVECPDGGHEACGTISCPECAGRTSPSQPGFVAQGTFYARVARRHDSPRVFSGWNHYGDSLVTLIQYWIFYAYDRWQTETVIGRLTQEHEGDWEHVSVGLGAQDKPLFVALSAHCGGQVVSWDKIAAAPGKLANGTIVIGDTRMTADQDVTHPIVAVAKGSHANYAVSSGRRPPDWGSCKNLPSDGLSALSFASNVRDLTEDGNSGWFAYPADVQTVREDTPPMSYPGSWGTAEYITFGHRKPARTAPGPLSPPLQTRSWDKPVALYFCGKFWRGDIHGTKAECS
jgi:hypothetical protein